MHKIHGQPVTHLIHDQHPSPFDILRLFVYANNDYFLLIQMLPHIYRT